MTTAGADTGSTETCTFCGKHRNAVRFLIVASHGVAICEACVGLCSDMLFVEEPLSPAAAKRRLFAPAGPPRTIAVNPDGSGDYATIQEAVAAANPGDTVELADGVYFGEILIDRPLTLRGGGSDRCWLSAEVSGGRVIVVTGTSGVHIAGLRITGVPTSELSAVCIDVSSVDIADCRIEDGGKFGIAVTGGSRLTVTGATIGTSSAAGIAVGDASDVTLQACLVLENAGSGVSASGSQVVVLDSAMRKNGQAGIALLGKSAGRVQNCEIAGNRRGGIVANGESTIRLISGTVYGNLPVGVWVHGGSHAHVEKTIIAGNGSWGIDATGIGGMNNATSAVSLNNCFWANGRDLTEGVGSTLDLFADPLIVADDSGALSLQKGSPCIGDTRAGDGIGASMVSRTTAPALTPSPEHLMQLRSLCLSCVRGTTVPRRQAVGWMASAAAMGLPVPFGVAYDLGLLFRGRRGRLSIACPQHLPMDSAMQSYVALLLRVADHPVTQRMAAARASDRLIALVLTRLFREVPCPEAYRLPTGEAGERFLNRLRAALAGAEPERLWRDTPAAERPSPHAVFSEAVCAVIEANLAALDIDELSFLERLVSCDGDENRDASLVRLLTLTEAEPNVRLTLAGARRLLHDLASQPGSGADRHDMPLGGYCAVTRRPSGGTMLLSELVYPRPFLLHRIANREALYYEHTHDRRPESTLAYIIVQVGYGLGGSGEILARALLLALAQHAAGCGYHVRYSFAGRTLTGPEPLDRPSDVLRALQYRDPAIADGAGTLSAVLEHLQGWRRTYRRREVLWIVSECFDADHADEHAELYHALEREASQTAWIVSSGRTASPLPAHRMFPVRHYLGTGILHRLVPGMPPVPAYATRQTEMDHDPV